MPDAEISSYPREQHPQPLLSLEPWYITARTGIEETKHININRRVLSKDPQTHVGVIKPKRDPKTKRVLSCAA